MSKDLYAVRRNIYSRDTSSLSFFSHMYMHNLHTLSQYFCYVIRGGGCIVAASLEQKCTDATRSLWQAKNFAVIAMQRGGGVALLERAGFSKRGQRHNGSRGGTLSAALWTTMKAVLPDMGAASLSHPGRVSKDEVTRSRRRVWEVVLLRNEKRLILITFSLHLNHIFLIQ